MLRTCIVCGQEDDHPRHVIALPDGNTALYHHDCHARLTGDPVSKAVAECGLTGDELRKHIQDNDPGGAYLRSVQQSEEQPVDAQSNGSAQ